MGSAHHTAGRCHYTLPCACARLRTLLNDPDEHQTEPHYILTLSDLNLPSHLRIFLDANMNSAFYPTKTHYCSDGYAHTASHHRSLSMPKPFCKNNGNTIYNDSTANPVSLPDCSDNSGSTSVIKSSCISTPSHSPPSLRTIEKPSPSPSFRTTTPWQGTCSGCAAVPLTPLSTSLYPQHPGQFSIPHLWQYFPQPRLTSHSDSTPQTMT